MWPLSIAHLENTRLAPATAGWRTQSIMEFAANDDAVLESTQARRTYPSARRISVPRGKPWRGPSAWSVLRGRRTARSFSSRRVPMNTIAQVLTAAAGVTGEIAIPGATITQSMRAWPSAGALYPIELYVAALDEASYHFDPVDSCLEVLVDAPVRDRVAPHVMTIAEEMSAPLLFVLTAMPERTLRKYGERGYRYLWLDAGHLAQNILLACTAAGVACCPIGGFHEREIGEVLNIDSRETALYLIAAGYQAGRTK